MESYIQIAEEGAGEISSDFRRHLPQKLREMKFVKVSGKELSYSAYLLRTNEEIPEVASSRLVAIRPSREIPSVLELIAKSTFLPHEIRVICPDPSRKDFNYAVFVKD